jgi:hypothetical protein
VGELQKCPLCGRPAITGPDVNDETKFMVACPGGRCHLNGWFAEAEWLLLACPTLPPLPPPLPPEIVAVLQAVRAWSDGHGNDEAHSLDEAEFAFRVAGSPGLPEKE